MFTLGDALAVDAGGDISGRLDVAFAAGLNHVGEMDGRLLDIERKDLMAVVAIFAGGTAGDAMFLGNPVDAGTETLGLFGMAGRTIDRLRFDAIVGVFFC